MHIIYGIIWEFVERKRGTNNAKGSLRIILIQKCNDFLWLF